MSNSPDARATDNPTRDHAEMVEQVSREREEFRQLYYDALIDCVTKKAETERLSAELADARGKAIREAAPDFRRLAVNVLHRFRALDGLTSYAYADNRLKDERNMETALREALLNTPAITEGER